MAVLLFVILMVICKSSMTLRGTSLTSYYDKHSVMSKIT